MAFNDCRFSLLQYFIGPTVVDDILKFIFFLACVIAKILMLFEISSCLFGLSIFPYHVYPPHSTIDCVAATLH
jgi:hypothetical protein